MDKKITIRSLMVVAYGVELSLNYILNQWLNGRKLCTMRVFALYSIFGEMQQITCATFVHTYTVPSSNFTLVMHQHHEFSYKVFHFGCRILQSLFSTRVSKCNEIDIDFPSIFIGNHVITSTISGKNSYMN